MTENGERAAWITLAGVDGVGPAHFDALVGQAGGADTVLGLARRDALDELPAGRRLTRGVRAAVADAARDPDRAQAELDRAGVWTITALDAAYPPGFGDLADPPPVLYGQGDPGALAMPRRISVVGTRRPSVLGRALAGAIARQLVQLDAVVVSGLAFGIDGAAQAATVAAGGVTVGVIGSGHQRPGPRAHAGLVRDILVRGAVVGELAPHARPTRGTFPRRNRLLSALAQAVIVVEAPTRSGAVNTAHHALEQGRALFVVPGRPGDRLTAGCLRLLRETEARPVVGLDELVADLVDLWPAASAGPAGRSRCVAGGRADAVMGRCPGPPGARGARRRPGRRSRPGGSRPRHRLDRPGAGDRRDRHDGPAAARLDHARRGDVRGRRSARAAAVAWPATAAGPWSGAAAGPLVMAPRRNVCYAPGKQP